MMDEARIEIIDRYLNNQMTVIERSEFEAQLSSDSGLFQDVQMVKQANELIKISVLQNDADLIKGWQPPKKPWFRNIFPGLGAIIFVALVLGVVYYFKSQKSSQIKDSYEQVEIKPAVEVLEAKSKLGLHDSVSKENKHKNIPVIVIEERKQTDSSLITKKDSQGMDSLGVELSALKSDNTVVEISKVVPKEKSAIPAKADTDTTSYSISVFNCATANFILDIQVNNTCIGKEDGEVLINNVSGGSSPYSFSLDSNNYSKTSSFSSLSLGQYVLYLKDSNGCSFRKPFDVLEKDCRKNDFAFSPETGQKFIFPLLEEESGYIKIMSVTGEIMFQSAIQYGSSWDGISQKGNIAPVDSYPYIIRLNNGRVIDGTVTITSY